MRTVAIAVVALASTVLAGACGGGGGGGGRSDGTTDVVAALYPLAELAREVGGGDVVVRDLTPAGAEPHDLELTTDQVDAIEDADVVLLLGHGFQPAVEKAAARTRGTRLDLAARGSDDPHVWLDPVAMAGLVDRVSGALAEADVAHRAGYEERAAAFRAEVEALDREYRVGLADCDRRTIVTSHAAFSRLAARYDLRQEAISGLAPDAEPAPTRVAELAGEIRDAGVTTVFTETLVSPRVAEALAREAGVTTAVLDPIEGRTKAQAAAGGGYVDAMRTNLAALRRALGCR
jgi:zinc transport system substrate-binding protein